MTTRTNGEDALSSGPGARVGRSLPGPAGPTCLLLTSSLGHGHLQAAENICTALRDQDPGARLHTIDFWSLMNPGVANAVRRVYLRLVEERPALYEQLYALDEHTWRHLLEADRPPASVLELLRLVDAVRADVAMGHPAAGPHLVDRLLFPMLCATLPGNPLPLPANGVVLRLALVKLAWDNLARRLERQVRKLRPDVVAGTQMIPSALLAAVKRRTAIDVPSIAVVTDFGLHDFWRQAETDLFCVGHESVGAGCEPESQRTAVTGLPLAPDFEEPPDRNAARQALGIEPVAPLVLVLGGGLGLGVAKVAARVLTSRQDVRVVAVAGRNTEARTSLEQLASQYPGRVTAFGWTGRMATLMRAADIVVGKPGGLTVAECMACGRPLLATGCLRGQEGYNLRFLQDNDVGWLVEEDDLPGQLRRWLGQPDRLADAQSRAWRLGIRNGAARVGRLVLSRCRRVDAGAAA
jgi:UDP-N-acetylglucosamine:LPS N-acetylglucosamine transferase